MDRLLLVDADILCWRAATSTPDLRSARKRLEALLQELTYALNADRMTLAISDRENWRRKIFPDYKSHRKAKKRPENLPRLFEYLAEHCDLRRAPGLEADDILGLLATGEPIGGPLPQTAEKIVVSPDKDLRTIPGLLARGLRQIERISHRRAEQMHLRQCLVGDSADGYKGCPRVGEKTADQFFRDPFEWVRRGKNWVRRPSRRIWDGVVSLYAKAGLDETAALTQARVARILRAGEYDIETGAPRLWRPSQILHH
jgi:DNA polymerase-1